MNRLRDESGWDSLSERGIELLCRVPASSSRSDLKRRVWAELQEISAGDAIEPRHARLKAFALGIAVVASAATAGAAIGGRWIAPRIDRTIAAAAAARTDVTPRHHRGAIRRVADAREATPIETPPIEAPAETPAPEAAATDLRASPRPARHSGAPAVEARTEVLDALVALRRGHDADRAAALLDRYLGANRHGALREEALALAIEAADARGDAGGSRRLSRLYLREFPGGRFGEFAGQHVGAHAVGAPPVGSTAP
jgi:hypothetical protein